MPIPPPLRTLGRIVFIMLWACSATAAEPEWLYGVKPGDTLISIADNYLARPDEWPKLQTLNHIADPKRLVPGSQLRLPVALLKQEPAVAEAIHVQGQVTRTPKHGMPQPLAAGMQLGSGDRIATQADASVSLRFVDGSRLLLTPLTDVTLTEMTRYGKTGMARTLLELHRGNLDTQVAKQIAPSARYEIKSRALNLAVRGTDFRAHVSDADQTSRSEVLDGTVRANGARGKALALHAGFGTLAAPGEAPRAPQILPPAPDLGKAPDHLQRVPLRFEWGAAKSADRYHAQVFADRGFEHLLLDSIVAANHVKWVDLPDGRYVLRVRAIERNGLEGANADHDFTLKARPEPPFISGPLDGQKIYGPQASLRWSASSAAQAYHVQLSSNPDFSTLLADVSAQVKNEYVATLDPGSYYWRIASVAAGQDQGPFSDVQAFTQRAIPASPPLEPPQIDDKRLLFRWRTGDPGEKYQVQVARDTEFAKPLLDRVVAANQCQIEHPEPGLYYLRVKTIDADGYAGPFGAVQQFEVPGNNRWWLLLLLAPLGL